MGGQCGISTDRVALVSGSTTYLECASVVVEVGDFWGTGDADGEGGSRSPGGGRGGT